MTHAKQRILLVDDEPQILVALEDLLSEEFVVFKADSAERALDLMGTERNIAVVITDQRMPRMTGDELSVRLRRTKGPESILVTGYADLAAVVRAVNEGQIFAYVTKPWDAEDLKLKVSEAANRYRLTRELTGERQLLHDLMRSAPDGIYFKNRSLEFLRVNDAFARLLGLSLDEVVGRKLSDLPVPAGDSQDVELEERQLVDQGTPILGHVRELHTGGRTSWVSESKAPIRDKSGRVVGLVGMSRDVTHQRELEQQVVHAQKMQAVGRVAGGIAHDFNNLLAVIQSYGELVREGLPKNGELIRDVEELLKATERAGAITRQLLCFSRRQTLRTEKLDLNQVIRDIENMIQRVLDKQVHLRLDLVEPLPCIEGDVTQLEQVILNLVINARDAMPQGGELTVSTLTADPQSNAPDLPHGQVILSVADTGHGMPPEVKERIFEPFFSTKEEGKGTGLGLATVYGIVERFSGSIRVDSAPGAGTTFVIAFPALDLPETERAPDRISGSPWASGATILLVEANEAVRSVAARILRGQGYKVLEAEGPREARELATNEKPIDLLLTDAVMPTTTGRRLFSELRVQHPDLRVLFMSGYAADAESGTFAIESDEHVVEKPFSPARLTENVRQALRDAG